MTKTLLHLRSHQWTLVEFKDGTFFEWLNNFAKVFIEAIPNGNGTVVVHCKKCGEILEPRLNHSLVHLLECMDYLNEIQALGGVLSREKLMYGESND